MAVHSTLKSPQTFNGLFSSACNSLRQAPAYCFRAARVLSGELIKEGAIHSLAFAPSIAESLTGIQGLTRFTSIAAFGINTFNTLHALGKHSYQVLTGSTKLISPQTVRTISYCAYQALLSYAFLMTPADKYFENMDASESLCFTMTLVHSIATAYFLGKQAYHCLKESQLLQNISPFHTANQAVDWKKIAQTISKFVIAGLSFYNIYHQLNKVVLAHPVYPNDLRPGSFQEVMKHLPGEDPQQVEQFFTTTMKECNKYGYFTLPQGSRPYDLDDSSVQECYDFDKEILKRVLTHSPDLLSRIYLLKGSDGSRRFKNFQEFLNHEKGLKVYFKRYSYSLYDLLPKLFQDRTSFEDATQKFQCYSYDEMSTINLNIPIHFLDSSRCYGMDELEMMNVLANKRYNLYHFLGQGKITAPAVYLQAASDWNGAFQYSYEPIQNAGEKEKYSAPVQYIKDHRNLYFGHLKEPNDLCKHLAEAQQRLGKKIQHLWIAAHGTPNGLQLYTNPQGRHTYFSVDSILDRDCLRENVAENAIAFLHSCSTGAENAAGSLPSFAERFAYELPSGSKVYASKRDFSAGEIDYTMQEGIGSFSISIMEEDGKPGVDHTVVLDRSSKDYSFHRSLNTQAYIIKPFVRAVRWINSFL